MFWLLILIIAALALYAANLRNRVRELEQQQDFGRTSTQDLAAWLDLMSFEWLLHEYNLELKKDGLSNGRVAAIKAERNAMVEAFHNRDAQRKRPAWKRPLIEMPIIFKNLYDEYHARRLFEKDQLTEEH